MKPLKKQGKRKDAYFGYVDRRWCGTPYLFLTDWLWGAVAGASLPAWVEASILLAEACLSYARQNYWDAMRFAGWQLQSISF